METELIERAISEIENPTLASTTEYLQLHTVRSHYDTPKVERIDFDSFESTIGVYFPIVNEDFYMVVHFSKETHELQSVEIENSNMVYITATSEEHDFKQLADTCDSFSWKGWSKGELMPNRKSNYYYTRVTHGPIKSKAYELETALKLLLTELEKDAEGVQKLAAISTAYIAINRDLYISSNISFRIGSDTIARISKLNLDMEIEQYVSGNEVKD